MRTVYVKVYKEDEMCPGKGTTCEARCMYVNGYYICMKELVNYVEMMK